MGVALALSTALGCFHNGYYGDVDPEQERRLAQQARQDRDRNDDRCYDGDPQACFQAANYDENHHDQQIEQVHQQSAAHLLYDFRKISIRV